MTKEVFDNRNDPDLSLSLSDDGTFLASIAAKGTNVSPRISCGYMEAVVGGQIRARQPQQEKGSTA